MEWPEIALGVKWIGSHGSCKGSETVVEENVHIFEKRSTCSYFALEKRSTMEKLPIGGPSGGGPPISTVYFQ